MRDTLGYEITLSGSASVGSGKFGQAYNFTGANADRATLINSSGIDWNQDWTISLWFNTSATGINQVVLSQWVSSLPVNPAAFEVQINTSNFIVFNWADGGTASTITSASTISASTDYHLLIVRRETTVYIYLDGVLENSAVVANINSGANDLIMGFIILY